MMLYGYHFSTIENNWEDLTPLNEFLQTFADDDGDVSQRDKESLKEIIAKSDTVIYAELSGDFPLGDSRQPIYKSLRPFDLVS
ncbi:hypothetical protein AB987_3540 [Acinetobacter baumannii]|nr:hypothetical protein AB987_3540 [Acinetobacter baumannii]